MRHPVLNSILLLTSLVLGGRRAEAADDGLTATCNGSSITVSFAGVYYPDAVPFALVWRQDLTVCGPWTAVSEVRFFPLGQQVQFQVEDAGVVADHLYQYRLALDPAIQNPPYSDGIWLYVYDAYAGCGSAPIAYGPLGSLQWDPDIRFPLPLTCPGTCYPSFIIYGSTVDLTPYTGGQTSVALFGSVTYMWQWGWTLFVTGVEPRECSTLAIKAVPWGHVKQMFR